ncbi:MAG: nitrophenyl compound nitroreductase subunit ArsF family protein [Candidatus Marinimicrobia bacterium]|nr:nitrophenyl compound nitroreductase subunit ArsF family protein [Candidatus Neomarinimicrobiota bacterium]
MPISKATKQRLQKVCSGILLVFALVSIGYMLGKNSQPNSSDSKLSVNGGDHIAVYYMHSTFRCETCNTIEVMTKDLLDSDYAQELSSGMIKWQEVDFMKNKELAQAFEIAASCVVVAKISNGKIANFQRLDEVWSLLNKPERFNDYIRTAIEVYIKAENDQ